jgi:3-deoxy-D-manno-octulosonate 8-phosphate phosphatase (KDO 8-P phosphatase)
MKRFDMRDGMGVERLRNAGIATAIITGETTPIVGARAKKLGIEHVALGAKAKDEVLGRLANELGMALGEIAYIGDDVNDAPAMALLADEGIVGCPFDAQPAVVGDCHFRTNLAGGHGAFRSFAEAILLWRE